MNGRKHVDLTKALQWLEGDRQMLERIRLIFLKNIPEQVQKLENALEGGDAGLAERMAHTIKGSAAMMGAALLSSEAARVELCAIDRDLHEARRHFASLSRECDQVLRALEEQGEER